MPRPTYKPYKAKCEDGKTRTVMARSRIDPKTHKPVLDLDADGTAPAHVLVKGKRVSGFVHQNRERLFFAFRSGRNARLVKS